MTLSSCTLESERKLSQANSFETTYKKSPLISFSTYLSAEAGSGLPFAEAMCVGVIL
jgi:hypothetical protein